MGVQSDGHYVSARKFLLPQFTLGLILAATATPVAGMLHFSLLDKRPSAALSNPVHRRSSQAGNIRLCPKKVE